VTITPEGIGTSEGAAALALHGLGVPWDRATSVALGFRTLALYLPLVAAAVITLWSRLRPALSVRLIPGFIGTFAAVAGMVNLLSAVQPALVGRAALLAYAVPAVFTHGSRLASAFAGFALLTLSVGLWRRKRLAFLVSQGVLLVSIYSHIAKGLDWEEAIISLTVLLALLLARPLFTVRSDTPTVRRGLWVLLGAVVFTLAYGTAGFYLLNAHYKVNFSLTAALRQTVEMFVSFDDPHLQPTTGFGEWFADSIYLIAAGALGNGLLAVLAPVLLRRPATPAERMRARVIIERYGRSSVARFALFDDKSYRFSEGGSVIAYALVGRVAVCLGDPIGPPDDSAAAIADFRALCERNDWLPAFYHALPDLRSLYSESGFVSLCIGQEAVVPLPGFSLEGRARKSLRRNIARAEEQGYRGEMLYPPHSAALLDELEAVSDSWLETRGGHEKRFSLGWFDRGYLQEGPIAVVHDASGRIVAFANVIPAYQADEATIDLMRRIETECGVMDLLFVTLFDWARERGCGAFNLGLAPLSGVGVQTEDPTIERAMHFLYNHLNTYYGFRGLHAFKEKFAPRWEPRFLIVPHLTALPAVALAIVRADNANVPLWRLPFQRIR
jgi:phosphatidylglycerol lysyltransferase